MPTNKNNYEIHSVCSFGIVVHATARLIQFFDVQKESDQMLSAIKKLARLRELNGTNVALILG